MKKYRISVTRSGATASFYFKYKIIRDFVFWLIKNKHDYDTELTKWSYKK